MSAKGFKKVNNEFHLKKGEKIFLTIADGAMLSGT
jgi:hypothetical protein